MNKAYLGIGGNQGDRRKNLTDCIALLRDKVGNVAQISSVYETAAWGNENQPGFYNQVVLVETDLFPEQLLTTVLEIEASLGRVRKGKKWGERTMDIDILFYNNEVYESPNLNIPHPYIAQRNFVLIPLNELTSEYIHPVLKCSVLELLNNSQDKLVVRRVF